MKRSVLLSLQISMSICLLAASPLAEEEWSTNRQVINAYDTDLEFTVMLQEPRGIGTNKAELLSLLGRLRLESAPQSKKELAAIIGEIKAAKPYKPAFGSADITISKYLDSRIYALFDAIKAKAKEAGVDVDSTQAKAAEKTQQNADSLGEWQPKKAFDGRLGPVLISNSRSSPTYYALWHPDNKAIFQNGQFLGNSEGYLRYNNSIFNCGGDWGVQLGEGAIIVNLKDVAEWVLLNNRYVWRIAIE
jgi:hypothetical protein